MKIHFEPVLLAIVTASVSLFSWTAQQYMTFREERRKDKEELYKRLLDAVVDMGSLRDSGALVIESQRMWLYASDEVLNAVSDYSSFYLKVMESLKPGEEMPRDIRRMIETKDAEIRLAIRRDIMRTEINKDWIENNYRALGSPPESIRNYRKQTQ